MKNNPQNKKENKKTIKVKENSERREGKEVKDYYEAESWQFSGCGD